MTDDHEIVAALNTVTGVLKEMLKELKDQNQSLIAIEFSSEEAKRQLELIEGSVGIPIDRFVPTNIGEEP